MFINYIYKYIYKILKKNHTFIFILIKLYIVNKYIKDSIEYNS